MESSNLHLRHLDISRTPLKPRQPNTFWRSPYRENGGNTSIVNNAGFNFTSLSIRPLLNVTQLYEPDNVHNPPCNNPHSNNLPVKSILKNKAPTDLDPGIQVLPETDARRPNLITTGTGKGLPHGSNARPKTTAKRVQFTNNRVPYNSQNPSSTIDSFAAHYNKSPLQGRRLYLDKNVSARILGSSLRAKSAYSTRTGIAGVNGDHTIRSQVTDFVKKVRLAETGRGAKVPANQETPSTPRDSMLPDIAQKKTADKFRKTRAHKTRPQRPDWTEYDLDLEQKRDESNEYDQSPPESEHSDILSGSKTVSESDSTSINSFASKSENPLNKSESNNKGRFHSTPNASLFTKYRHITSNYMNRYVSKVSVIPFEQKHAKPKGGKSTNFCDSGKTDQILGWLEEVRSAQTPRTCGDSNENENGE